MSKKYSIILIIVTLCAVLMGFSKSNKYFVIAATDVVFKTPEGFPKPVYKFKNNKLTPEIFVLGRMLFYDPILSKDSTVSCATCHQRIAAFAHFDHKLSHGINGLIGRRNVPALQNLAWKSTFMWDGGVNHLEVQPLSPLTNPVEMNETIADIINKLRQNQDYVAAFRNAFHDTVITSSHILKALAQFTGLMISADAKYDKCMKGADTFTVPEKRGLMLFRDKCAKCHEEPLFTDNKYRNNGLKPDTSLKDIGRGLITGETADYYKFLVPGLRNIERTYPYMHDGRFRNLKEVLDYYGNPANFYGKFDAEMLEIGVLTNENKSDIIAFLNTLTDYTFLYDRRFVDPFMQ